MRGLIPRLASDAFSATEEQLGVLNDRFMGLLVHTDLLAAQGYEVTNEVKNGLMRIVTHLRAVRHELLTLSAMYRAIQSRGRALSS